MAWIPHGVQSSHQGSATLEGITRAECLRDATRFSNCSWVKFDCYGQVGTVFPSEDSASIYGTAFSYTRSLYWPVVSLTAIGYGDIAAFSTVESYFAAAWIFVGGIINFGILGAMSSLIANAMAPRQRHLEQLNSINSVMGRLSISDKLRTEVRRFYHHHFKSSKLAYESELLAHLPDQLCYQLSSLLHAEVVQAVALFGSASARFVQEVTGKFRHRTYETGDSICIEGDACREFIVLLRGSKANVFIRSRKAPVRALHEGDSYGVYEFLLGRPHSVTLVAASTVHASVMTRVQFDAVQTKFDADLQEMAAAAKSLFLEQQLVVRRISRNLERAKLKPHALQTRTLFYRRVVVAIASGNNKSGRLLFATIWEAAIMLWNLYNAFIVIFLPDRLPVAPPLLGPRERRRVARGPWSDQRYRRSARLQWNLVASLPLYVPAASGSLAVSLFRLPRLIRSLDLWAYCDSLIVKLQQHFAPLRGLHLLLEHGPRVRDHFAKCWLEHDTLINKYDRALWVIYAKSDYWAASTLLLTTSREPAPRDLAGTIWVMLTCLGCSFAMGYVGGEITDLIGLGKERKQHCDRVASFESFAKKCKLPDTLRERFRFFSRAQFEHSKGHDWAQPVRQLPANLRIQFLLESELLIPGDEILAEGAVGNRLCTLQKGAAAAFWTKSVANIAVLVEGALFG
ncbi:hypothetical protein PHYPSEUDO_010259 [Phytophthora pseudosyringae]|uniref:Cyclic nucleotide-binding domain-containing protein n=1 Tax=Phytophthora pseudosyringae TaxID=221518 RepID=A0A8T1VAI7_9STRA|nr:hypothetical protein PHYPSEUDO_010259 [Phytophthora pseudosyringae]